VQLQIAIAIAIAPSPSPDCHLQLQFAICSLFRAFVTFGRLGHRHVQGVLLVGMLEDPENARHRERLGSDAAIEREVDQLRLLHAIEREVDELRLLHAIEREVDELRLLHRLGGVGRARAGRAHLEVLGEDRAQLLDGALEQLVHFLLPHREAEDVRQIHLLPSCQPPAVEPARERGRREALHGRRCDHRVLFLLAQVVGDDAVHALRQVHLRNLLVLDVAAQPEAHDELVECHHLGVIVSIVGALARHEHALGIEPRLVRVAPRQRHALYDRRRVHHNAIGHLALDQVVAELLHRHQQRRARRHRRVRLGQLLEAHLELRLARTQHQLHLRVLLDHLPHLGERARLRLREQVLLEQRLEAAGQWDLGRRIVPNRAKLRVRLGEREHHDRLQELVQLERIVAALGLLA
jgi:hypothetical protein